MTSTPPRFGWNAGFSYGTEKAAATANVAIFDKQWKKLGGTDGDVVLFKDPPNREDLLYGMAKLLHDEVVKVADKLSPNDKEGENLVMLVPTPPQKNVILEYWNRKNPYKNLDLNQIPTQLRLQANAAQKALFNPKKLKVTAINNSADAVSATHLLAQKHPDKFQPGMDAVFLNAGGGLAVTRVNYTQNAKEVGKVRFDLTEDASQLFPKKITAGDRYHLECMPAIYKHDNKVGNFHVYRCIGGDIHGILSHFKQSIPLRFSQQQAHPFYGDLNLDVYSDIKAARKVLPDMTQEEYEASAKTATLMHLHSLSLIARNRLLSGGNLAVLTGPVNERVNLWVNQHPHLFKEELEIYDKLPQKNRSHTLYEKLFLAEMWKQMALDDSSVAMTLFKQYDFDVVANLPSIDSTTGMPSIAKGHFTSPREPKTQIDIPAVEFLQKQ